MKYNRVVENIIRVFTEQPGIKITKYLTDDRMSSEDIELKEGWNTLDMTNDFKYGFSKVVGGPLSVPLTEVDFSHYTGTELFSYLNHYAPCGKVVLPDTMNELPEKCLFNNNVLQEVVLGKNTKIIGHSAFGNCQNLSKCVLPEGLKEIQDRAFVDTDMGKLILPKSIEKLGEEVCSIYIRSFYEELPVVRFQGLEPPVLNIESFHQGTTLEVPMAAVETYKNIDIPGWKEKFGDNVVGY